MKLGRLFLLLPLIPLASCSFNGGSSESSSQRPYSGPGYSTSSESKGEESVPSVEPSSSQSSSIQSKREKAYEALDAIKKHQESSSFVDPKERKFSGSGRAKVSSVTADLNFGYDKANEYFHVTVSTSIASYDRWVYKAKSSRNTYIYNVNSLTKKYTRKTYASGVFESELADNCIPYEPVKNIVDTMYSYTVGKTMLDELGSTFEESSITSEKYTYGDEGDLSANIRIDDGDNNNFTESFSYIDYLGSSMTRKGTVSGAEVNTSTTLDFSYCDTSDLPNLYEYSEDRG